MSNYPDDIRLYSDDPRSPYNYEKECSYCKEPLQYENSTDSLVCTTEDCINNKEN
jgi:hypothetical protein